VAITAGCELACILFYEACAPAVEVDGSPQNTHFYIHTETVMHAHPPIPARAVVVVVMKTRLYVCVSTRAWGRTRVGVVCGRLCSHLRHFCVYLSLSLCGSVVRTTERSAARGDSQSCN
jgi:hypothetical protein